MRLWVWISTHIGGSHCIFSGRHFLLDQKTPSVYNSGLREHKGGCRSVWPGERGWGRRSVPFLFSSCRELVLGVNRPGSWSFKLEVPQSCPPPSLHIPTLCWHWTSQHYLIRQFGKPSWPKMSNFWFQAAHLPELFPCLYAFVPPSLKKQGGRGAGRARAGL